MFAPRCRACSDTGPLLAVSETYTPAFHAAVIAGPQQVMCAYNAINGVPACLDGAFQNTQLRSQWGFDGSVVSDCDAIKDAYASHHAVPNASAACAAGIVGGCDQDCGGTYSSACGSALSEGLLDESAVDTALQRTFLMRFRLGEFDDDSAVHWRTIPLQDSNSTAAIESALGSARESITLLNNSLGLLPISNISGMKVAVVGPLGNDAAVMMGAKDDYDPEHIQTISAGLNAAGANVNVIGGCKSVQCTSTRNFDEAVRAARSADVTVAVMGIDSSIEAETRDRTTIGLPGNQGKLVQQLAGAVGDKLILVLVNGGPLSVDWARHNVATVLEAYEGGEAAGTAVAEVLTGSVNPSGVLPYTVYPSNYVNRKSLVLKIILPSLSCV